MDRCDDSAVENFKATELTLAPPGMAEERSLVVGWPPIRAYRKSCLEGKKKIEHFIKVSMDGAPYLRKIDLGMLGSYKDLRESLVSMFGCFSMGFSNMEGGYSSEYAIAYEDKDGDWMLVGDVPWE